MRVSTDGAVSEAVSDTPSSLALPAGVAAINGATYVTDLSSISSADVFSYTY